jgi:hypothetical protein
LLPWFGEHIHKSRFQLQDAFSLNLLKSEKEERFVNEEISLIDYISNCSELQIFNEDAIMNYIDYKWEKVGRRVHLFGCANHFVYLIILAYYVDFVYYDAVI